MNLKRVITLFSFYVDGEFLTSPKRVTHDATGLSINYLTHNGARAWVPRCQRVRVRVPNDPGGRKRLLFFTHSTVTSIKKFLKDYGLLSRSILYAYKEDLHNDWQWYIEQ